MFGRTLFGGSRVLFWPLAPFLIAFVVVMVMLVPPWPSLGGLVVATGQTHEETERNMYEAIQMHVDGLIEDGSPIPESTAFAEYVMVGA